MTDLVKSLKIGNNSYSIKDEKATPFMSSEDKDTFIFTGKYRGDNVSDITQFVDSAGKTIEGTSLSAWDLESTLPSSYNKWTLAYGNGVYVLVSYNYFIYYSTDNCKTWESATFPTLSGWLTSVAFDGSKFIAINETGSVISSTDGATWTSLPDLPTVSGTGGWKNIQYLNNQLIALRSNAVAKSTDGGSTWTLTSTLSSLHTLDIRTICYGANVYVMPQVTNSLYKIVYSSDLTTWTEVSVAVGSNSVAYGNGAFIASSFSTASDIYLYSTDGINWVQKQLPINIKCGYTVFANNMFYLLPYDTNIALKSSDGITWEQMIMPVAKRYSSAIGVSGKIISVGTDSCVSYNIALEGKMVFYPFSARLTKVCYGDDGFVATSFASYNTVAFSKDGFNWENSTAYSTGSMPWSSVAYGNGVYICIQGSSSVTGNLVAKSTNGGRTWSTYSITNRRWTDAVYGGERFVAVSSQAYSSYSTNGGETWTEVSMPTTGWVRVAYGNGKFVAISSQGYAAYSTDGSSWTSVTLNVTPLDITFGNGKFVLITQTGSLISTDGVTWSSPYLFGDFTGSLISYGDGVFVVTKGALPYTSIAYSTDAQHWNIIPIGGKISTYKWTALCYGAGKFISVYNYSSDRVGAFKVSYPYYLKDLSYSKDSMDTALAGKQDSLTAHKGIEIANGYIGLDYDEIVPSTGIQITDNAINIAESDMVGSPVIRDGLFTPSSTDYLKITGASTDLISDTILCSSGSRWSFVIRAKTPSDFSHPCQVFMIGSSLSSYSAYCTISADSTTPGTTTFGVRLTDGTWYTYNETTVLSADTWYDFYLYNNGSHPICAVTPKGGGLAPHTIVSSNLGLYGSTLALLLSKVDATNYPLQYDLAFDDFISNNNTPTVRWRPYGPQEGLKFSTDALRNTATGTNSLTIDGTANTNAYSVNIGKGSQSAALSTAVGVNCSATGAGAIAIGYGALAGGIQSVALGREARSTGQFAIQIGTGTNSTPNTMQVRLSNDLNVQLLDSSGKVPTGRYIAMTGADGTNAGTIGAVPAPTATDNTKFLRGDGTWAEAGGGGSSYTAGDGVSISNNVISLTTPYEVAQTLPASPTAGKIYFLESGTAAPVVVETYSNGVFWYRLWSDGWCEQGGYISGGVSWGVVTVNLLKTMADTNYSVKKAWVCHSVLMSASYDATGSVYDISNMTTSSFPTFNGQWDGFYWEVRGYAS